MNEIFNIVLTQLKGAMKKNAPYEYIVDSTSGDIIKVPEFEINNIYSLIDGVTPESITPDELPLDIKELLEEITPAEVNFVFSDRHILLSKLVEQVSEHLQHTIQNKLEKIKGLTITDLSVIEDPRHVEALLGWQAMVKQRQQLPTKNNNIIL